MKISIKVKTKAREEKVERLGENNFTVFVKALPIEGRANDAIIKLLAKYFKTSKSSIEIVSGHKSKNKIVEIAHLD